MNISGEFFENVGDYCSKLQSDLKRTKEEVSVIKLRLQQEELEKDKLKDRWTYAMRLLRTVNEYYSRNKEKDALLYETWVYIDILVRGYEEHKFVEDL